MTAFKSGIFDYAEIKRALDQRSYRPVWWTHKPTPADPIPPAADPLSPKPSLPLRRQGAATPIRVCKCNGGDADCTGACCGC